ncbi:MAG TPA: cytochrome c [Burkholderiaceae bacterium]|nr:cytochrome c [Burkholderiaceae bacterium]
MRTPIFAAATLLLSLGVHDPATAQSTQAGTTQMSAVPSTVAQASGQPVTRKDDAGKVLYTVVDGYKVDANTMNGFRAWRAAACDRCHGANQQGMVGPSLIESLKTLSKDDFVKTLHDGRLEKGMPSWQTSKMVMDNMDNLYAYLKGRSNGDITRAHVEELKP